MLIEEIGNNVDQNSDPDNPHHESACMVNQNDCGELDIRKSAKKVIVGAGARILFYPTLFYNVVRNKVESEFHWWDEVDQNLLLGAVPFPKDVPVLKALGVGGVVTLNEPYETLVPTSMYQESGIKHLLIPTRDYLFAPSYTDICRAVNFIHENISNGKTTYVHCKAGRGRSTTIVLCYLVKHKQMTPTEAYEFVKSKRPRVLLAASQWKAVQEYEYRMRRNLSGLTFHLESAMTEKFLEIPVYPSIVHDTAVTVDMKDGTSDDSIVIVTAAEVEGYGEIEGTGLIGNELWKEFGMSYRVRIIAAKGVMRMVRASTTLAKLSYLMVGCQSKDKSYPKSVHVASLQTIESCSLSEQLSPMHATFPVCAQGVVNC